jgi:hypothetical protein
MKTLQLTFVSIFTVFAFTNCESPSTDEKQNDTQPQKEEPVATEEENVEKVENNSDKELTAMEFAKHVSKNLKEKTFENWNEFSAERVYFSPYSYVDTAKVVSLNKSKFNKLFESEKKIIWGHFDGSGEEIKFSIQEYFNRFVTDFDLTAENNQLLKDTIPTRGSQLNNIKKVFPNATIVEIHKPASEESMGMDWRSLMLVIQKVDGTWKLKALVHNEWTT